MICALLKDCFSGSMVAQVLGVTSPNTRTIRVRAPVDIPAPALPSHLVARIVANEEAEILTMLFQIRIALNIFPGSSINRERRMARRSPPSARFRTRILLTVVIAVSEEEKNAEQAMRKIKISTCMASDASNVVHSFFLIDKYV